MGAEQNGRRAGSRMYMRVPDLHLYPCLSSGTCVSSRAGTGLRRQIGNIFPYRAKLLEPPHPPLDNSVCLFGMATLAGVGEARTGL